MGRCVLSKRGRSRECRRRRSGERRRRRCSIKGSEKGRKRRRTRRRRRRRRRCRRRRRGGKIRFYAGPEKKSIRRGDVSDAGRRRAAAHPLLYNAAVVISFHRGINVEQVHGAFRLGCWAFAAHSRVDRQIRCHGAQTIGLARRRRTRRGNSRRRENRNRQEVRHGEL